MWITSEATARNLPSSAMLNLEALILHRAASIPFVLASLVLGSSVLVPREASAVSHKPPCRIDISDAHISTYFREVKKINAVKINAVSICDKAQKDATIYVEIHKTGWLSDHLVETFKSKEYSLIPPGKATNFEEAFVFCRNDRVTKYYGIVYGKALVEGKLVYAPRGRSANILPLKCGT